MRRKCKKGVLAAPAFWAPGAGHGDCQSWCSSLWWSDRLGLQCMEAAYFHGLLTMVPSPGSKGVISLLSMQLDDCEIQALALRQNAQAVHSSQQLQIYEAPGAGLPLLPHHSTNGHVRLPLLLLLHRSRAVLPAAASLCCSFCSAAAPPAERNPCISELHMVSRFPTTRTQPIKHASHWLGPPRIEPQASCHTAVTGYQSSCAGNVTCAAAIARSC